MIGTPRVILAITALVCGSACAIQANLASLEMVDKVNEKLPKNEQFEQFGWYPSKTQRLHREYKRLYPSGHLRRKIRVLGGLASVSLLTCVWSMGFFGN